jgi:prefoldin subunit 5
MSNFQAQYDEYQQTIRALQEHAVSVDSQIYEHEVVLQTLQSVPAERKAWRLVSNGNDAPSTSGTETPTASGALVETTAKGAGETLAETMKGLQELKSKLEEEVVQTKKEFDDWKVKNNVKVVRGD